MRPGALLAVSFVGALLIRPLQSHACSLLPCTPLHLSPAASATVPANVQAIPLLLTRRYSSPAVGEEIHDVRILDPTGAEVPVNRLAPAAGSLEGLLIPSAPLTPGMHRLVRRPVCDTDASWTSGDREQSFTVVPAKPLPAHAGTIEVSEPALKRYAVAGLSGLCTNVVSGMVATLRFRPSPELEPFMSVATLKVTIDGDPWAATLPGDLGGLSKPSLHYGLRTPLEIFRTCTSGPVADTGARNEHVQGEVTIQLPLRAPLPPIPFEIKLVCPAVADAGAQVDAGSSDADASTADGAVQPADASSVQDAPLPPRPSPRSRGCAVARGWSEPLAPWWWVSAAALLFRRTARRPRSKG